MKELKHLSNSSQILIVFCILATLTLLRPAALGSPVDTANSMGLVNITNSSTALDFPDSPLAVDDNNIDSLIKRYPRLVVDCWTPDCRPCQLISPTIDQMAADFKGKIVFGKLNIWYNFGTREKYDVFHYPMLLMFENGVLVDRHQGNYPKEELERIILNRLGPI